MGSGVSVMLLCSIIRGVCWVMGCMVVSGRVVMLKFFFISFIMVEIDDIVCMCGSGRFDFW